MDFSFIPLSFKNPDFKSPDSRFCGSFGCRRQAKQKGARKTDKNRKFKPDWYESVKSASPAVSRRAALQGQGARRRGRAVPAPALRIQRGGQVTTELILLAVVLIVLAQLVLNQIKNNKYLEDFAKGPSQVLANMISNGNWKKNPEDSKKEHPNAHEKHYSWDPGP